MQLIRKSNRLAVVSLGACALLSGSVSLGAVEAVGQDGKVKKSDDCACCTPEKTTATKTKTVKAKKLQKAVVATKATTVKVVEKKASECSESAAKATTASECSGAEQVVVAVEAANAPKECSASTTTEVVALQAATKAGDDCCDAEKVEVVAVEAAAGATECTATTKAVKLQAANKAGECSGEATAVVLQAANKTDGEDCCAEGKAEVVALQAGATECTATTKAVKLQAANTEGECSGEAKVVAVQAANKDESDCCAEGKVEVVALQAANAEAECSASTKAVKLQAANSEGECSSEATIVALQAANKGDGEDCCAEGKAETIALKVGDGASECSNDVKAVKLQAANKEGECSGEAQVVAVQAANDEGCECCDESKGAVVETTAAVSDDRRSVELVSAGVLGDEPGKIQSVIAIKQKKTAAGDEIELKVNGKTYYVKSMEEAHKIIEKHGLGGVVKSEMHFGGVDVGNGHVVTGTGTHGIVDLKGVQGGTYKVIKSKKGGEHEVIGMSGGHSGGGLHEVHGVAGGGSHGIVDLKGMEGGTIVIREGHGGGTFEVDGHAGGDVKSFGMGGGGTLELKGDGLQRVIELQLDDKGNYTFKGDKDGHVRVMGGSMGSGGLVVGGDKNVVLRSLEGVNIAELQQLTDRKLNVKKDVKKKNVKKKDAKTDAKPRAMLGVMLGEAEEGGVRIAGAIDGTPAAKAGFQEGDLVVGVAVNGKRSRVNLESLRALIAKQKPGTEMTFAIVRGDKRINTNVKLAKWDDEKLGVVPEAGEPVLVEEVRRGQFGVPQLRERVERHERREMKDQPDRRVKEFHIEGADIPQGQFEFRGDGDLEKMMLQLQDIPGMSDEDMAELHEQIQEAMKNLPKGMQRFEWKGEDGAEFEFDGEMDFDFDFEFEGHDGGDADVRHERDGDGRHEEIRVERHRRGEVAPENERGEVRVRRMPAPPAPGLPGATPRTYREMPNFEKMFERLERRMQEFEQRMEKMMEQQKRLEQRLRRQNSDRKAENAGVDA